MESELIQVKILEEMKVGFTLDKSRDISSGPCPLQSMGTHAGWLEGVHCERQKSCCPGALFLQRFRMGEREYSRRGRKRGMSHFEGVGK